MERKNTIMNSLLRREDEGAPKTRVTIRTTASRDNPHMMRRLTITKELSGILIIREAAATKVPSKRLTQEAIEKLLEVLDDRKMRAHGILAPASIDSP